MHVKMYIHYHQTYSEERCRFIPCSVTISTCDGRLPPSSACPGRISSSPRPHHSPYALRIVRQSSRRGRFPARRWEPLSLFWTPPKKPDRKRRMPHCCGHPSPSIILGLCPFLMIVSLRLLALSGTGISRLAVSGKGSAYFPAASFPAIFPNTISSRVLFPATRPAPYRPPTTSPAANRPSMTVPDSFSTCASLLIATPPMV